MTEAILVSVVDYLKQKNKGLPVIKTGGRQLQSGIVVNDSGEYIGLDDVYGDYGYIRQRPQDIRFNNNDSRKITSELPGIRVTAPYRMIIMFNEKINSKDMLYKITNDLFYVEDVMVTAANDDFEIIYQQETKKKVEHYSPNYQWKLVSIDFDLTFDFNFNRCQEIKCC